MADSLNEALIETVVACGGSKAVGVAIWPAKGVEAAQRHLLACLNSERNEKLGPEEIELILSMGRKRGCHAVMQYLDQSLSYAEPQPIEPKDELADLLRQYLATRGQQEKSDSRLQQLIEQHIGKGER